MTAFRYLVWVMITQDDDWPAVVGNLQRSRKSWGVLSGILSQEGADPKVSGHYFKELTHVVLLFGGETWILTPRMERALSSLQHRVARQLTRRHPRRRGGGGGVSW